MCKVPLVILMTFNQCHLKQQGRKGATTKKNIGGEHRDGNERREDGRKVITDPHFHGGRIALGNTETPALTLSSCGSWATGSCQSPETWRPLGRRHLGMTQRIRDSDTEERTLGLKQLQTSGLR